MCLKRAASVERYKAGWQDSGAIRLGAGYLNEDGCKPNWMRSLTFERLTAEYDAFVVRSIAAMARRLGIRFDT